MVLFCGVKLPLRSMAKRCLASSLTISLLLSQPHAAIAQAMSLPGKVGVNALGAATYGIPIVVPPGTAGMAPSLSFSYSSQNSNGLLGMGWSLDGLPAIARCARTLAQDNVVAAVAYDANDRFCMDGQRLVAISGTYGADGTEYRTEIESFAKITSYGSAGTGPAWFRVRTKSGQILEFGNTTDSRVLAQGKTSARAWVVNKVSDTLGNFYTVTYTNDATNGQAYPARIDYTANAAAGLQAYNSVQFSYAARSDITPHFQAGSIIRTTSRLTNVKTYAGSTLVGDYRLAYQQSPSSLASLISSVTLCAGDGSCLPATSFSWSSGGTGVFTKVAQQVNYPTDGVMWRSGAAQTIVIDLDGDGKSDVLQIMSGDYLAQALLSNGDGTFRRIWQQTSTSNGPFWRSGASSTFPVNFGDGKVNFLQIMSGSYLAQLLTPNADGTYRMAWKQLDNGNGGYFWRTGAGATLPVNLGDGKTGFLQIMDSYDLAQLLLPNADGTYRRAWQQTAAGVGGEFWRNGISTTYPIDVYGDGRTSFLQILNNDYQAQVLVPNADGTYRVLWKQQNYPNDGLIFRAGSGYTNYLVDTNGDGKTDLLQIANDTYQAQLLLANGDGTFRRAWLQQNYPNDNVFWRAGTGATSFVVDTNGDGRSDIFQIMNGTYIAQLMVANPDGTYTRTWQQQNYPTDGPFWRAGSDATSNAVFDPFGDGKSSILQIITSDYRAQVMRPNGSVPDVLTSITTGIGTGTQISYRPLTDTTVYTKENTATYPINDVIGAMYVVSRIDTSNGLGGSVGVGYSYVGAKADLTGRGFLGFRQMKVTDLQTNVVHTTTYRQDYPYVSLVAGESKSIGAQTLAQTTNTYASLSLGGTRYQVSLSQSVVSGADLDGSALPTITNTYQYDTYGNATQIVASTSDGHTKTTTNTFTNDLTSWILGRLTAASVTSQSP